MSQNEENETADRPGEVPAQSVEANLEADSIATQSEEPAEAHHSEPDPDPELKTESDADVGTDTNGDGDAGQIDRAGLAAEDAAEYACAYLRYLRE